MTTITCDQDNFVTSAIPKMYNMIKKQSDKKFIITINLKTEKDTNKKLEKKSQYQTAKEDLKNGVNTISLDSYMTKRGLTA